MTRGPGDDGLSPGDIGDPVADSIRAQQNRDAMPSPEEARAEARRALKKKGCKVCGEDDPDVLDRVMPWFPSCPTRQTPRDIEPIGVFCDEHRRSGRELARARTFKRAYDKDAVAVIWYDCGVSQFAIPDDDDGPQPHPYGPGPKVPVTCRCDAQISEIVYLNDD